jgi:phytoene dehydrogenase-like protein
MTGLPDDVDVAVIGAGHNGLVAACYLAKAGLRVTVVEACSTPGGMTASGALIPDAPRHIINSCAVDLISMLHSQVPHDLDLKGHGLKIVKVDPSYVSLAPDGESLALWRDPRRTASEIAAYSRADGAAFLEFMNLLDRVITLALPIMGTDTARPPARLLMKTAREGFRHRASLSDIVALLSGSASMAVDERFEHPVVKGALLNLAAGAGPVDLPGSGAGFLLLALISRVGVGRPIGGMQSLTAALIRCLESYGGSVVTDAEVTEILHSGARCRGLRLRDGREVQSRAVVSSADPWTTLRTMVTGNVVDRRTAARLDHSSSNGTGSGVLKIDLALSAQARAINHERTDDVDLRRPTLLIATEESVRDSYASAARGELPDDPAVWLALPSAEDPSQAPDGQDSAYIYSLAAPVAPREGWVRLRRPAVESVLGKVSGYVQPLEQAELGRIVETPEDLATRLRTRNGCITHIDMGFFNTGPFRPTVGLGLGKTPLEGLFLGGSGTHPGGGVSGLPGRTAAQRTARYLKKI